MEPSEQPTAPYLDAVVAYAFRGPARYHVPGPQGRARAPIPACARRSARTPWPPTCRRTSTGSTSGRRRRRTSAPSASPPRPSAPSARSSSPTAPRRATTRCAWRSPRSGARIVAQRNSHASIVDGLVLSGGLPSFVAPEYDEELGITHCVTPEALERALRRRARRAGRVHRLADLLRHGRRRRGAARRSRTARASRSSSTRRGARTSASTRRCRRRRSRRAPTRCSRARTRSPAR